MGTELGSREIGVLLDFEELQSFYRAFYPRNGTTPLRRRQRAPSPDCMLQRHWPCTGSCIECQYGIAGFAKEASSSLP